MKQEKRKIYFINKKMQWRFMGRILWFLLPIVIFSMLMGLAASFIFTLGRLMEIWSLAWLYGYVALICFLAGIVMLYTGMFFSNCIYGPIYHFKRVLNEAIESSGKVPGEIKLRKKDEFKDLAAVLNKYFEVVRTRDAEIESIKARQDALGELINQNPAEGKKKEVIDSYNDLCESLKKV